MRKAKAKAGPPNNRANNAGDSESDRGRSRSRSVSSVASMQSNPFTEHNSAGNHTPVSNRSRSVPVGKGAGKKGGIRREINPTPEWVNGDWDWNGNFVSRLLPVRNDSNEFKALSGIQLQLCVSMKNRNNEVDVQRVELYCKCLEDCYSIMICHDALFVIILNF